MGYPSPTSDGYYKLPDHAILHLGGQPIYEVSEIFSRYFNDYLQTHDVSFHQWSVIRMLHRCRTWILGAHARECNHEGCGYVEYSYNSCRDRHCPKCQGSVSVSWVSDRLEELLPIPYYHVVFTLPQELNNLCLCNKQLIYNLFFKAASETLLAFGRDEKYLGAELGFIAILHTWGQSLCQHVHLHLIVGGGGISVGGKEWKSLPYRKQFLFPSRAMSKVMRGKFIDFLKKAYRKGKLAFPGQLDQIASKRDFEGFINQLAKAAFYNYCKKPFGGPEAMVKYVGRYTHKVAISNKRLVSIDDGTVSFTYKDYKAGHLKKLMRLSAEEFIRRFLLHILPKGFQKIRYYGFLANGLRKQRLECARKLLGELVEKVSDRAKRFEEEFRILCPKCERGYLKFAGCVDPNDLKPLRIISLDSS